MYTERLERLLKKHGYTIKNVDETCNRVNHCKAWESYVDVMDDFTGEVFHVNGLQSYNTLTAVNMFGVNFTGSYSMTSWQHFHKWCNNHGYNPYCRVTD